MLSKKYRPNRLGRYYDALSSLLPEEQAKVVSKKRSKEALKAMLSDDAPQQLRVKFAHRFKEVMDMDFSPYERGKILSTQGEFNEANVQFEKALDEGDLRGHEGLGDILFPQGKVTFAEEIAHHYERALSVNRDNPDLHYRLARIYGVLKNNRKADQHLRYAIRNCKSEVSKLFYEGQRLSLRGKNENAVKKNQQAVARGHTDAMLVELAFLTASGEKGKMRKLLENAIEFGYTVQNVNFGDLLLKLGDQEGAIEYYHQTVEVGCKDSLKYLISLLISRGNFDEAHDYCDHGINTKNLDGYLYKAHLLKKQGRDGEAVDILKRAIKEGFDLPVLLKCWMYLMDDKIDKALELCENEALHNPAVRFCLMGLYEKNGEEERAIEELFQAIELNDVVENIQTVQNLKNQGHLEAGKRLFYNTINSCMQDPTIPFPIEGYLSDILD